MPNDNTAKSLVGPELQSLPLPMIISAAMNGIVSAQAISAKTTADFLKSTSGQVEFSAELANGDGGAPKKVSISVPELAVVPVPSLRVDSATIHFNFEIKEFVSETKSNDANGSLTAGTTGFLKSIVSANISGSISHKNSSESTMNRSGMLDITIHLSEPPLPEGLSKVLSLLSNAVIVKDAV